ncbi:hypothetical protein P280DRAFT_41616 [Massarina eburnea CBS 473.64]|uniref:Uncharacterized protein n=1 Tax=Massarina eburnea CBS 473.64 TaxID=1395130 RepID=A0A6A6RX61_9PLEO|nr:hypothetical protein P280DRAFT_41616 [Massarina eburnea CBS 473.64]
MRSQQKREADDVVSAEASDGTSNSGVAYSNLNRHPCLPQPLSLSLSLRLTTLCIIAVLLPAVFRLAFGVCRRARGEGSRDVCPTVHYCWRGRGVRPNLHPTARALCPIYY